LNGARCCAVAMVMGGSAFLLFARLLGGESGFDKKRTVCTNW